MVDLEQPRLCLPIEQDVEAKDLEAREADVVVAEQRVVDMAKVGLDGKQRLDDEGLDLGPRCGRWGSRSA